MKNFREMLKDGLAALLVGVIFVLFMTLLAHCQEYSLVSGRVLNARGRAIAYQKVVAIPVTYCDFWRGGSTLTNSFGYYFLAARTDCAFIVAPVSKFYQFENPDLFLYNPFYDRAANINDVNFQSIR